MPDVRGSSVATAANTLTGMNLQVREVSVSSTAPSGRVVRESPVPGTRVNPGSSVTLYYSSGGVTVPSVVGDPAGTAQQILSQAGFTRSPRTRSPGRPVHPGQRVLAESQSAGPRRRGPR